MAALSAPALVVVYFLFADMKVLVGSVWVLIVVGGVLLTVLPARDLRWRDGIDIPATDEIEVWFSEQELREMHGVGHGMPDRVERLWRIALRQASRDPDHVAGLCLTDSDWNSWRLRVDSHMRQMRFLHRDCKPACHHYDVLRAVEARMFAAEHLWPERIGVKRAVV